MEIRVELEMETALFLQYRILATKLIMSKLNNWDNYVGMLVIEDLCGISMFNVYSKA